MVNFLSFGASKHVRRVQLLILSLLCCVSSSAAIRLASPGTGETLSGGAQAIVEWASDEPLPATVEEWEAFLSVDGGVSYPVRITPHLDRDVRRFSFDVPNVESTDARILLRIGDEQREVEIDLPVRFSIRASASAPSLRTFVTPDTGERGAIMWVSGTREGTGLQTFVHRTQSCSAPVWIAFPQLALDGAEACDAFVFVAPAVHATISISERAPPPRAARRIIDRLLQTRRMNI